MVLALARGRRGDGAVTAGTQAAGGAGGLWGPARLGCRAGLRWPYRGKESRGPKLSPMSTSSPRVSVTRRRPYSSCAASCAIRCTELSPSSCTSHAGPPGNQVSAGAAVAATLAARAALEPKALSPTASSSGGSVRQPGFAVALRSRRLRARCKLAGCPEVAGLLYTTAPRTARKPPVSNAERTTAIARKSHICASGGIWYVARLARMKIGGRASRSEGGE